MPTGPQPLQPKVATARSFLHQHLLLWLQKLLHLRQLQHLLQHPKHLLLLR